MGQPQLCRCLAVYLTALAGLFFSGLAIADDGNEFFERKILPVLAEHCFSCHSHDSEKIRGGLLLDSKEGVLKGGDNGPVVIPGDPESSPLIVAVRYTEPDFQMPPKDKKLADQQIADLEAWVRMGAPDPRGDKAPATATADEARNHWAFQPVRPSPVPSVKDMSWVRTPVDSFILAKLEANNLRPAPPADKRTLIRRATFDLTGLPPTYEAVEAFTRDTSPDAFSKVVDRLLASPRYGERWGRYWLDVARFADTKGYVYSDREEKRFVHSYAYRDWVIRAFNTDLPYDRFLKLQIAADQVPDADRDSLAAMGFLTLGRRFLGVSHDIIDDRIDTVTRGMLGLTVTCARCHDHKFDPIPTRDYYSLYGVFAATTERLVELNAPIQNATEYLAYESELKRRENAFQRAFSEKRQEQSSRLRARVSDYLVQAADVVNVPTEGFYTIFGADDINPIVVRRWYTYLLEAERNSDPVWLPWHAYAGIPTNDFASRAPTIIDSLDSAAEKPNALVVAAFKDNPPASMREVAAIYGQLLAAVDKKWREASDGNSTLTEDEEALRQVLYAEDSPSTVPAGAIADLEWYFDESVRVELGKLAQQIDEWIVQSPGAPPHALILEDRPSPPNPRVFRRGNPANVGDEVPRQFLEILAGPDRQPFTKGSGRLELAEAIASRDNPLTARVMVNRIWQHHFGAGLVRTPSDFGIQGEAPTHPELLDWLASEFMDDGWSIKKLHRTILLSSVYQQSSDATEPGLDPENRFLARSNRQRLDFEALRDSLLFTSGELETKLGGPAQEMFAPPFSTRRTVYGYLDRQLLPGVLRVFDFANPDMHTPQRSETTVPQQALFFMNGPFVIERAKSLAARATLTTREDPDQTISELYRLAYQRNPTPAQLKLGHQFLQQAAAPTNPAGSTPAHGTSLLPWEQYAQALLSANEFLFVD